MIELSWLIWSSPPKQNEAKEVKQVLFFLSSSRLLRALVCNVKRRIEEREEGERRHQQHLVTSSSSFLLSFSHHRLIFTTKLKGTFYLIGLKVNFEGFFLMSTLLPWSQKRSSTSTSSGTRWFLWSNQVVLCVFD
jgi:hypothetical protein